jgi:hypothetical protein
MEICHSHNLSRPIPETRRHGIRVTLRAEDPFVQIIGSNWQQYHWYAGEQERDRNLAEMSRRHEYSRRGDVPTLRFEKVER